MKLNRQQRHMAYMIMLAEAEAGTPLGSGFCYLFTGRLFGYCITKDYYIYDRAIFKKLLPELFAKRPKQKTIYWFPYNKNGWQKRIRLLKQCINETYDPF